MGLVHLSSKQSWDSKVCGFGKQIDFVETCDEITRVKDNVQDLLTHHNWAISEIEIKSNPRMFF